MNDPPDICETLSTHAPQRTWVAPLRVTDESITGQQTGDITLGAGNPEVFHTGPLASLGQTEASQAVTYHTWCVTVKGQFLLTQPQAP